MNKTLYVSDLDGTLLLPSQVVSNFTADAINKLTSKGMLFSYATARSLETSAKAAAGITAKLPVITNNGVFIKDNHSGENMHANYFTPEEAQEICSAHNELGLYPLIYSTRPGCEKFTYYEKLITPEIREFLKTRPNDVRDNPIDDPALQCEGQVFYFAMVGGGERLNELYECFKDRFYCVLSVHLYDKEYWLEIMPKAATKANAILQLKEILGCDKVVCFGDAENDIPMFQIADECYAVANAVPELKAIATGVIGSNAEDGVAKWLLEHFEK